VDLARRLSTLPISEQTTALTFAELNDRTTHPIHSERTIYVVRRDLGIHLERGFICRAVGEAVDHFKCFRTHSDILFDWHEWPNRTALITFLSCWPFALSGGIYVTNWRHTRQRGGAELDEMPGYAP
jgi:hypothetical protein